jgi:hypothetical protein
MFDPLKPEPDYETRLRDEVAMRAFVAFVTDIDNDASLAEDANVAFDYADAFMAERARRTKGG